MEKFYLKILITVKTYPTLSSKYDELVCTAGITEDGKWIRLYPLPFRKLDYDNRYSKYQWIELDAERNFSDPRPESYRPYNYDKIILGDKVDTDKGLWTKRKKLVLKKVYNDLEKLINEAKDRSICTSLAVFKPSAIIDFKIEETSPEWDKGKLDKLKQLDLFQNSQNPFEIVRKLPYKFSYVFIDVKGRKSKMMIEDWEIGQLYWNCLKRKKDTKLACIDVKKKYFDDFVKTKNLYFYLGTTRVNHFRARNPFLIIGAFYPKKDINTSLKM